MNSGEIYFPRIYQPEGASSFLETRSAQISSMATCYVHLDRPHEVGLGYPAPNLLLSGPIVWKDVRHLHRILSGRARNQC